MYSEQHDDLEISSPATVLTFEHTDEAPATYFCRVTAGPIVGNANYMARATVNGLTLQPDSIVAVEDVSQALLQSPSADGELNELGSSETVASLP